MNTNQLTIAEAIEKVTTGFSSVYTKEDVIGLLNAIQLPEPVERLTPISERLSDIKDSIVDRITDHFDNDIVDFSSATFRLDYGNTIELEDIDLDHRAIGRIVEDVLTDVIFDLREEEQKNDVPVESEEESSLEGKNEEIEG